MDVYNMHFALQYMPQISFHMLIFWPIDFSSYHIAIPILSGHTLTVMKILWTCNLWLSTVTKMAWRWQKWFWSTLDIFSSNNMFPGHCSVLLQFALVCNTNLIVISCCRWIEVLVLCTVHVRLSWMKPLRSSLWSQIKFQSWGGQKVLLWYVQKTLDTTTC